MIVTRFQSFSRYSIQLSKFCEYWEKRQTDFACHVKYQRKNCVNSLILLLKLSYSL